MQDYYAIINGIAVVARWECRKPQKATVDKSDSVDIQSARPTFMKSFLHGGLVGVTGGNAVEPSGVARASGALKVEGESRPGIVRV
jgi:hypothetical protein